MIMSFTASPVPRARYLSIVEAADYLNVGVRFMRRLVGDRRIRHYKVGKFLRFDPADLDAFAAAGEVAAAGRDDLVNETWRAVRRLAG
jgi:excisionase family DNA binding protein